MEFHSNPIECEVVVRDIRDGEFYYQAMNNRIFMHKLLYIAWETSILLQGKNKSKILGCM